MLWAFDLHDQEQVRSFAREILDQEFSKAAREIKKLWKEVNGLDAAKIKTATAALAVHEEAA